MYDIEETTGDKRIYVTLTYYYAAALAALIVALGAGIVTFTGMVTGSFTTFVGAGLSTTLAGIAFVWHLQEARKRER